VIAWVRRERSDGGRSSPDCRILTGLAEVGQDIQNVARQVRQVRATVPAGNGPVQQALHSLTSAEWRLAQVLRDLDILESDLVTRTRLLGVLEGDMFTTSPLGPLPPFTPGSGAFDLWPGPDANLPGPDINLGPDVLPGPDVTPPGIGIGGIPGLPDWAIPHPPETQDPPWAASSIPNRNR
jgi:hypothetical protein